MTNPLTRAPGLAEVTAEDHATVLNLPLIEEQQVPYVFEGTAFDIWVRIDGTGTEAQIVAELAEAYEIAPEVIAPEVRAFVAQLAELGLVQQ
ncbi:PqqD family protein [Demequina rhizosphaerae]|uniref:PqqD family protein n=1 Tax=Demequina rhizosphaerae TaxID=1638985 RepID=UPI00155B1F16|nr:PqqD family protein [Demequina rhizosphaerae]